MVAVFTGNGLGLFNTTSGGGAGGIGQGKDGQLVNLATGNLVLQSQDEQLVFRGLPVAQLRTYNSLGALAQTGADGWLTGFERRVELLSGTFNQAGSIMRRHMGDGSYQDFVYAEANKYVSTAGEGGHDTLTFDGSVWTYTEGSTRYQEDYETSALQGRLRTIRAFKSDGVTPTVWDVSYDAQGRITAITANDGTGNGDALLFGYDPTTGYLSSVSTREGGVVRGQVTYAYDAAGRLSSVTTDLTPDNAGDNTWGVNNDGRLFRTTYTYVDSTSLKIASITQSDGSVVSYTYQADGKLRTVTAGSNETVTFTYGSGTTTVTDSLGRAWTYGFDANGRLTSVTSPAMSGQSDVTTYAYDASGNLTQAKTVRGAATLSLMDYAYDSNGNVTWEWDGANNAISRTYSASNQLLSETRYTGVDADRAGIGLPTGGLTTRYVYDARDRLRFVVTATGSVTEYEYASSGAGIGQSSAMRQYTTATYSGVYDDATLTTWSTAQQANGTLTEYSYDQWGRLKQSTAYATLDANGAGVLDAGTDIRRFTYDAQGLLRQQAVIRGASRTVGGATPASSEVVDYAYDGMGRLLAVLKRNSSTAAWAANASGSVLANYLETNDGTTVATSYAYLDSGHQLVVTQDGGATRTETRNAAGHVISVAEAGVVSGATVTRAAQNYYDAAGQLRASEDANGARTYFFYDAKGRVEAVVDGTGAVMRSTYDGADRVLQEKQYANRVTTTSWLSGGSVTKATFADIGVVDDATNDRVQTNSYDAAGRLATQSTPGATTTTYAYDAADRLLSVTRSDLTGSGMPDRVTRYFYDAAGRVVATLDGEGYLSESTFDAAGRPVNVIRYANVSPSSYWATGTLAQLRPATHADDQTTRYYYDARGNQVGELDAEGYFTERTIDEAGNTRAERRYLAQVTWQSGDTLASLRSRAGSLYRESRMAYNALGQLLTQTNPEGTVTRYSYDEAGRLVRTEAAQGTTEVREGYARYNVFNELIGEISGEGAENAKTVLLGGKALNDATLSETQLDQAYATYGVRHSYNALGQRTESIDAAGNKSWYFYDSRGRATFVVRGVADTNNVANALGEVTETRYNAFGNVIDSIAYTGRITFATPGDRASVDAAINALRAAGVSATDSRRQFTYNTRGQLASITDAESALTQYSYNGFGERSRESLAVGTTAATTIDYTYDRRGLLRTRTDAAGTSLQRGVSQSYDAFGRVKTATDARGATSTFTYDRLGRQITRSLTVQGRAEVWTTAYDAFDRVTSVTDPLNKTTTYVYSTANRTVTVTTPEGVAVTTTYNRHGQTVTATQTLPDGSTATTTQTYDRDGHLKTIKDALNQTSTNEYDVRGLLAATVDASGRRVELRYDAAGRVLQRIEDPGSGKLNLTTTYAYDGQGRQINVTDASGRVTSQQYDREGRLKTFVLDPGTSPHLNAATTYTYDALGRQVTVTDATGRVEQYAYDALSRRTSEQVNGANTISYVYDANDNVVRRTDANGAVTRFYYNEANRLVYTIDALGAMTRTWYDMAGREVAIRAFVTALDASTLTDTTTIAQLDARLSWNSVDQGAYRVFDTDGRLRFVLSSNGNVTETVYDSAGRVVGTRGFAAKFSPTQALLDKLFAGTATPAEIMVTRNDAADQQTWQVYDAAGRVRYHVDALGNTQEIFYDAAGRTVGTRAYAAPIALDATLKTQLQAGSATVATLAGKVAAIDDDGRDLRSYQVFDAAGRARFTVDALGSVQEIVLDGAGRTVATRTYATAITVDATLLGKLKAGTASVADIAAKLTADDAKDGRTYQVYNLAGQLRQIIDSQGYVRSLAYDAAGRLTVEKEYGQPISAANFSTLRDKLLTGTATVEEVTSFTPVSNSVDRMTTYVYDAAGQVRYTLTRDTASTVAVSEIRYDGVGRKVATVAYAVTISSSTAATVSGVSTALGSAGGNAAANQRQTRFVYDEVGQLRFTVDNTGAVMEQRYDGLGRVVESRQYGQTIALNAADVAAAVAGITDVRFTKTAYNAAGEIVSITDALNKTESFTYNGLGQRTQYTDKLNKVWTYGYDAAGRQISETSPAVSVATVDATGTVTLTSRSILTTIAYDALGNVTSRTENANASDVNDRRTTQYVYDNRGHQIKTIFPDAGKINEATGQIDVTGTTPSIEITYDARGRATVQKDVRGNYSYKVYDALDRVAYEVDQEGYVTGYTYNGFGEQGVLRRYATRLNTAVLSGWSAGQALTLSHLQTAGALPTSASDRTLTAAYDARGQKLSIVQSSVSYYKADGTSASGTPTTQFTYNAYGELVKESVLTEGTAGQAGAVWAETYRYYDAMGRNDLTVDAENYVTRTLFNARGEATETTEYARELTATPTTTTRPGVPVAGDSIIGYDRTTKWTYDDLGRKASETVVRRYQNTDGTSGTRDVATTYAYDAASRVTGVITEAGTVTTIYDALGRATSVREPVQTALNATADAALQASTSNTLASAGLYQQVSPYTTVSYDAFGNAVQVRRYANGWVEGAASATADNARDQLQTTRYDRQGRAVWERDAENNVVTREYDAADNVTGVSYTLDGNDGRYAKIKLTSTYDKAGRQVTSVVQRDQYDGTTLKSSTPDSSEAVAYNAFGDITSKAATLADLGNAAKAAVFEYNNAGQLTRSNADTGAYRRYGYNLAGAQVREERDWTDAGTARVAVTRLNVDKLGRTRSVVTPSFTADAAATSTITQTVDRWGNVVQVIDARGFQTDYEYNSFNQLVREKRATVLVVSETGARSSLRPTNEWFYDAFGRLVGTRDANGRIRTNEYDSAGRLTVSRDATVNHYATTYAYDLFGNQRYVQNALGHITLKQYDRLNRVNAIGDFLPNAAATTRAKTLLQQYRLNQSGGRLSVTDALGYTTKYDYDSRNQLIRSQSALGAVMQYAYDAQGRKTLEKYPRVTDESTPGYWEGDPNNEYEPGYWVEGYTDDGSRTDRESEALFVDENTWKYDYFGRVTDHNDLSRTRDFNYAYDANSGQLVEENRAVGTTVTARKTISYYANGQIREIVEDGGNRFRYEYDAAGNRTLEETTFKDASGLIVHTITRTYYDSNNRIQRVTQDNITGAVTKRVFHITYEYDAVGNRRHVISLSGYGTNLGQANPPPVYAGSLANRTLKDGVAVDFALPAGAFTDADEETLTYSAQVQIGTVWQSLSSVGLSIDPTTGRITGSADNLTQTSFNARIIATDPLGQTATGTFVFNVTNTPPVASTVPNQTAGRNQAFSFTASSYFSDVNGSALTFSATGLPSGLTISSAGVISGTVASSVALGAYTITVTANDGWGGTISTSFTLTVANSAPVAPTIPNQTATAGTAWSYVIPAFSDPNGDALTYSVSGLPSWMSFNASTRTLSGTPQPVGAWTITVTATDTAGTPASKTFTVTTPNVAPVVAATVPAQSAGRNIAWSYTIPAGTFSDINGDALTYSVSGLPAGLSFNAATRVISGTATTLGSSTVTVTVIDGNGGTRSTTFVLSVVNNPPSYNGGLVDRAANKGQSVSWTLPANTFSDANGDALTYTLYVQKPGYWEPYEIVPGEPDVRWVEPQWIPASNAGLSISSSTGTITGNPTTLYTDEEITNYQVKVTATDSSGAQISGTFGIAVNRAPTAYATTVSVGVKTAFSRQVTGFSDPDGNGLTYTATGLPAGVTISSSGVLSGTLNTAGDYAIQVTARDAGNLSATATVTLHVANTAPTVAVQIPNQSTQATVAWSYQVPAGTFTDANGDALTYSAMQVVQVEEYDAELHRYFYYDEYVALPSWLTFNASTRTFSGTAPSPQTVRLLVIAQDPSNASGSDEFILTVGAAPNYAPVAPTLSTQSAGRNTSWSYTVPAFTDANSDPLTYSASGLPAGITFNAATRTFSGAVATNGNYTLTITANDGKGGVTSASFTLNVVNSAPTAPSIPAQNTTAGVSWAYTVPAFTDPNGDALTYSVSGQPAWMSFNASTRQLSGMPSTVGTWTITVTATDAQGASVSANFTVTTPNRAPTLATALPSFTVGRGQSWSYQVPVGTFSDANGDALSYSASNLPPGISFDSASRTFSGAPTTLGSYTVTVSVADGRGGTASTTFSFVCGNSAPVYATALPNRSAQQNQSVSWALPANTFTDANGDALTYTALVELPGYWETVQIRPYPEPEWEDVWHPPVWSAISGSGLSINGSTGALSGAVHSVSRGGEVEYNYRVKLIATDPSGATAEGIFTVGINAPPTAPTIANQSIRASQAWSYTVPAFSDANGNALTYSASGLPAGLSFNTSTRVISGTPTTAGTYTVTVTANDGAGGTASSSFTLTVRANNLPVAPSVGNATGAVNNAFSYALPVFTDADYDALTYSASNLPPGLSFNASTRVISGTPTTAGSWTVTYSASDAFGGSASTTFVITVGTAPPANRAPVVSNQLFDQYADSGIYFSYTFAANTFTDPDGNPLTYTASKSDGTALPAWLTFNAATRTFSGTPAGIADASWDIRVTATDPSGLSVSDVFNLYKTGTGGGGGGQLPLMAEPSPVKEHGNSANAPGKSKGDKTTESTAGKTAESTSDMYAMAAYIDPDRIYDPEDPIDDPYIPPPNQPIVREYWFTYDAENRIQVYNGVLSNGQIIANANDGESYVLTYDAVGNEVSRVRYTSYGATVYDTSYDLRGQKLYEFHGHALNAASLGVDKAYFWSATGELKETRRYFASNETRQVDDPEPGVPSHTVHIGGWLKSAEVFTYDQDGRMVRQVTKERPANWANNLDMWDNGDQTSDLGLLTDKSRLHYTTSDSAITGYDANGRAMVAAWGSGFDAAGRATLYRYTGGEIQWATHTYRTQFSAWGGYQEASVTGTSTNTNYRTTTNTITYDGFGRLIQQNEHTNYSSPPPDRRRYYAYNGDGSVQLRREGTMTNNVFTQTTATDGSRPNFLFVHAAGKQIAELHEGTKSRIASLMDVNLGNYEAGGGKVVVQEGETLYRIAQRVYGTSQLWYVLAEANGLSDPNEELIAGTSLDTPGVKVNSNDANTFKPYNPGEAIGSTSPGLPFIKPPPKHHCNVIAMVLIIVVAVVVTVFTAGAAAMAMGAVATSTGATGVMAIGAAALSGGALVGAGAVAISAGAIMGAAAIGGFMGSVASQAVGVALGVQDHFSLRSAVAGGLTAGLTAGVGTVMGPMGQLVEAGKWGKVAASAAMSSIGAYAANKIAGVEAHFSWRSVAASAVSAVIGGKINKAIGPVLQGPGITNGIVNDMAAGMVGSVVSLHTRRAFGLDDKIDYGAMAIDAFGNALANAAVGMLSKIGAGTAHFDTRGAALAAIDQALGTATPEQAEKLNQLRADVEAGKALPSIGFEKDLQRKDEATGKYVAVNGLYNSDSNTITINQAMLDGAGTSDGAAGLLGTYLEEISEWVANQADIKLFNDEGRQLDIGAVNGMVAMQSLAGSYEHVEFDLGGQVYRSSSSDIFQASVRLFTPDRILNNVHGNGVYYQQTDYATSASSLLGYIQQGFEKFGASFANNGAASVGLAFGILEKGYDIVKGLAVLEGQIKGAMKFATLNALGLDRWAAHYRNDFNAMQGLARSVKGFVNASWGEKWEAASDAMFGGLFESWDATKAAAGRLDVGKFDIEDYFSFGRAAGGLVFEVVNLALTATGAYAAAKGAATLGRLVATRGAALARSGAAGIEGLFGALEADAAAVARAALRTEVRNGYTYVLDEAGNVQRVEGNLRLNRSQGRNTTAQRNAGGADRLPDDQGGHYIGRRFDGPTDDFNHFAQNGNFNNSAYKKLEYSWQRALESGRSVRVEIVPSYPAGSVRPSSLVVRQWIDGTPLTPRTFPNRPGG